MYAGLRRRSDQKGKYIVPHLTFDCPHCGQVIDLIGSVEIKEKYGLGPNAVESRRKDGTFPEPVLDLTNRLIWLRREVEDAATKATEARILDFVHDLERSLASLPEEEREKAREMLAKELDGGV